MDRVIIEKGGNSICTLSDWETHSGPKTKRQWDPERSAYELARAWCEPDGPRMPVSLRQLLEAHEQTRGLVVERVLPEHCIRFDDHGGEPRNADMAFVGVSAAGGRVAVTIEAKADEPFGDTVERTYSAALERRIETAASRGTRRIEDLACALLRPRTENQPKAGTLRYQLLTAVAGSLAFAEAEHAATAVLVIHEFKTSKTRDPLHEQNERDLASFLWRLCRERIEVRAMGQSCTFVGPIAVPGGRLFENPLPLYIGKIVTDRRSTAA